ncbi:hypothetical protein BGZ63DRAFT_136285 [Mariannaea sp. PMI_226]|nr:hypothetical protein BGZ63DRAFT_136285 [Mariannaea sp. PMI_226]
MFNAYPKIEGNVSLDTIIPACEPPFKYACYSSAPLEGILRSRIYYDEYGFCQGIILDYLNGTKRALGQCRVGLDLFEDCERPSFVCHRLTTYCEANSVKALRAVLVKFSTRAKHEGSNSCVDDLACSLLKGNLRFWFDARQAHLELA